MPPMATTTMTDSAATARRFAVACGVPSQYVKTAAPAPAPVPMPAYGAAQQLMIFYGGRVLVFDGCTPAKAAELILYAAAAAASPVARRKSLERFLLKRKDRSATAAAEGGRREETAVPPPAKKGKTAASSWLALGSLGDMHAQ